MPACMFRSGEDVFLDDITLTEVQSTLQVPVNIVKSGGQDLVYGILGLDAKNDEPLSYSSYELKELGK